MVIFVGIEMGINVPTKMTTIACYTIDIGRYRDGYSAALLMTEIFLSKEPECLSSACR